MMPRELANDEVANWGGLFCGLLFAFVAIERGRQLGPVGRHLPQGDTVFPTAYGPRNSKTAFGVSHIFV
jgi:hypothetical protein